MKISPSIRTAAFSRKPSARKNRGITQVLLAKRLDKPQSYVSKYENGERRLDVVEFLDIAACLELDAAAFIQKLTG